MLAQDKSKIQTTAENTHLPVQAVTNTAAPLEDNRTQSVIQKKQVDAMANRQPNQGVVQQKANNTGLPDNLKSGIENLSGHAMDDVKVHYNSSAPAQMQAHAYAQGTNIHIAPGQEKHLPHEAWHVVQQKQGRVQPTTQLKGKVNVNDDKGLEKEADVMGSIAAAGGHTGKTEIKATTFHNGAETPVQKVNKLGYEIEFRKNPIFKRRGIGGWGKAAGFLGGDFSAGHIQQIPNVEMQPDAARSAGIFRALDGIPVPLRSDYWAQMKALAGTGRVPEVKTNVEYASNELPQLLEGLEWVSANWYAHYQDTVPVAATRPYSGGMFIGIPVEEIVTWAIKKPDGDQTAYNLACATLRTALVANWSADNTPSMHLQVTAGVDLANIGATFAEHAASLHEKAGHMAGGADKEEVIRSANLVGEANNLANSIMGMYASQKTHNAVHPDIVHGAWAIMFQDLLRIVVGRKRVGSSQKNIFTFMPRSSRVTLDAIARSITSRNFFNAIMAKAEILLVSALHNQNGITPDDQTLDFLESIQTRIGVVQPPHLSEDQRWAFRFTTLFTAMDSFAHTIDTQAPTLPWAVADTREIISPKEHAVLMEDRHINKFVTDWASVVTLISEALGNVKG